MASRPYWSGQIRLSLVTLPVQLYSAVKHGASTVDLDQIDRKTHERIHHQNVLEDGTPVEREDIVKGYKVSKGHYILLEQEEIDQVKLPSSDVFALEHFIDIADLPLTHIEKPYYVVPDTKGQKSGGNTEIYGVIRDALKATGKAGIGQITLRGREELCALLPYEKGLLVQTLRYAPEVRDPDEFYGDLKAPKAKGEYLDLAKKLIDQHSGEPDLARFEDHYYEALMELIHAKEEEREPVYETAEAEPDKVIDLMAALRNSLSGGGKSSPAKKASARKPATKKAAAKTTSNKPVAKKPVAKTTASKTAAHKPTAKRKRA